MWSDFKEECEGRHTSNSEPALQSAGVYRLTGNKTTLSWAVWRVLWRLHHYHSIHNIINLLLLWEKEFLILKHTGYNIQGLFHLGYLIPEGTSCSVLIGIIQLYQYDAWKDSVECLSGMLELIPAPLRWHENTPRPLLPPGGLRKQQLQCMCKRRALKARL